MTFLCSLTGRMSATSKKDTRLAAPPLGHVAEDAGEQAGTAGKAWEGGEPSGTVCWWPCEPLLGAPPEKFLALPRVEPAQSGYLSNPQK